MRKVIPIKNLEKLLFGAARKVVSEKEALYFAQEQIEDHIERGHYKGFSTPLECALTDIEVCLQNKNNKLDIQIDKKSTTLINLNELGASLRLKLIHDTLEKKAIKTGIAAVGINNPHEFSYLSLWTRGLAKRSLVGIAMCNGGPESVVPFGGVEGVLGTNPISYSIPTLSNPIVADFATSEIPFFEILYKKTNSIPLDTNVAVDTKGYPTTDANKAFDNSNPPHEITNILPLGGGYKGYALVLLIEILTGSLVRSFLSTEMKNGYMGKEHGLFIVAIDVSSFTNILKFKRSVSQMCDIIRKQKTRKGIKKILIPGDLSYERFKKATQAGSVPIEEKLLQKLEYLAK